VDAESIVCVHGLTQHKGVFADMAEKLSADGHSVVAVDLRGHGSSGRKPPWNVATHVADLIETLDSLGIDRVTWIAHSFGGRLAAVAAVEDAERTKQLVLLDPGLEVSPDRALRSAEIDRLDWSFATVDGAANALMGSESVVAAPRETVTAYVQDDVAKGPDGRFRFSFCPSASVVGWSEMTLPPPAVAKVPTLLVHAEVPLVDPSVQIRRYEEELGDLFTKVAVPNGHNLLWESPAETMEAVTSFLAG